jgi:hypothetical protein
MTAPIELATDHRARRRGVVRAVRRTAARLHLVAVAAVVVAVFAQVYLIGAYIFGAGQGALDAHRSVGFTAHGIELLVVVLALVAGLARADVLLSLALGVIGTVQIALADAQRWLGGLHPLLALVVLSVAVTLARRAARRHGLALPARARVRR